jgi:hypothetical protein
MRASRSASVMLAGYVSRVACRPVCCAVVDLVLGIDLAGRVFAHEDDGKARVDAAGLQRRGAAGDFGADFLGEGVAVDELGSHRFRFSK